MGIVDDNKNIEYHMPYYLTKKKKQEAQEQIQLGKVNIKGKKWQGHRASREK